MVLSPYLSVHYTLISMLESNNSLELKMLNKCLHVGRERGFKRHFFGSKRIDEV